MELRIIYKQTRLLLVVFLWCCCQTIISCSPLQPTALHRVKEQLYSPLFFHDNVDKKENAISSFDPGCLRERNEAKTRTRLLAKEESMNNDESQIDKDDNKVFGEETENETSGESGKVNEAVQEEVAASPPGGEETTLKQQTEGDTVVVEEDPASGPGETDPSGSGGLSGDQDGQASNPQAEGESEPVDETINDPEQKQKLDTSGEPTDGGAAGGEQSASNHEAENPCKDIENCEACEEASVNITNSSEICFWNSNINRCRKAAKEEKLNLENMCALANEELVTNIAGKETPGNESTVNADTAKNEFLCSDGSECATRCKSSISAIEKCFGTKGGNDEAVFRQCVNCILVKEAASQLDAGFITGQNYTEQVCENQSSCERTCGACFPDAIEITSCAWNCEPPEVTSNVTLTFGGKDFDDDSAINQAQCGDGSECANKCEASIGAFENCFETIGGSDTVVFGQCVNCFRAQESAELLTSGLISVQNYTETVCRSYPRCESTCGVCFPEVVGIAQCAWSCEPPEQATLPPEPAITGSPSIPPSENTEKDDNIFHHPEFNNYTMASGNETISISLFGLMEILDKPQKKAFENATQAFLRALGDGTVVVKVLSQRMFYRSRDLKERSLQFQGVELETLVSSLIDETPGPTVISSLQSNEEDYLDTLISQDGTSFGAIEAVRVNERHPVEALSDESTGNESSKGDASSKEMNKIILFSLPLVAIILITLAAALFLSWKICRVISVQEKILSGTHESESFSCKSRESDAFDCAYSGDGEIRDEYSTGRKGRHDRQQTVISDEEEPYLVDRQMPLQSVLETPEETTFSEDDTRGFRSEESFITEESDDYISEEDSYQFAATSSIDLKTDESSDDSLVESSSDDAKHRRGNGLVPRQQDIEWNQSGSRNNDEDLRFQQRPFSYDDVLNKEYEINGGVLS